MTRIAYHSDLKAYLHAHVALRGLQLSKEQQKIILKFTIIYQFFDIFTSSLVCSIWTSHHGYHFQAWITWAQHDHQSSGLYRKGQRMFIRIACWRSDLFFLNNPWRFMRWEIKKNLILKHAWTWILTRQTIWFFTIRENFTKISSI